MTIAWVIGRGGLLGSAIERALVGTCTILHVPQHPFDWQSGTLLVEQIRAEFHRFNAFANHAERWEIYWAAGIGTMASSAEALIPETEALSALYEELHRSPAGASRGRIALASSAGAIYAGSTDALISERTEACPTTAYARAKLAQEEIARHSSLPALIGRISTLYGSSQVSGRTQGLLVHIARCMVRRQPIRIFVPLDTIRDYIAADDAAAMLIKALRLHTLPTEGLKIIASQQPVTISEILSIFKRLTRVAPLVVTSSAPTAALYARRIQFRSAVMPMISDACRPLTHGIFNTFVAERQRYVAAAAR